MIRAEQVSFHFRQGFRLHEIGLEVRRGEMFGIIGPNGSGKSTLIRLLSGIEKPSTGAILLNGRDVRSYTRKELSRLVAVLPQDPLPPVGYSVREVIEMGRYPYRNWLGQEKGDAYELIDSILCELGLKELEHRKMDQLSGGERQRVALGKVMAQQPAVLMLDEPTNSLDIGHTLALMDLIVRWRARAGLTVVAVLHDLNLAAQYCDRFLLMHRGRAVRIGGAERIFEERLLAEVYGVRPIILRHPLSGLPQVLLHSGAAGWQEKHADQGHHSERAPFDHSNRIIRNGPPAETIARWRG
jgi:iron complex transport system ATP-binding protein